MFICFFVANILVVEMVGKKDNSSIKHKYYNFLEIRNQFDYIKGVVAINNKWTPNQVDDLEYHHENYRGLFWWYNLILQDISDTNRKPKK